jgi:hypothetical protein
MNGTFKMGAKELSKKKRHYKARSNPRLYRADLPGFSAHWGLLRASQ